MTMHRIVIQKTSLITPFEPSPEPATHPLDIDLNTLTGICELGAQIVGKLPLLNRVRLRGLSRTLRSSVDESLRRELCLLDSHLQGVADKQAAATWLTSVCPNLFHVKLTCLDNDVLTSLAANCRQLRHLSVSGSPFIGDAGITSLGHHCPYLQRLDAGDTGITDVGLGALAGACQGLTSLSVRGCNGNTTVMPQRAAAGDDVEVVTGVTNASIVKLARGCPWLEQLDVENCFGVSDAGIRAVAAHCCRLRSLNVGMCVALTDDSIIAVAQRCAHLESLDVGHCPGVTDASISVIARRCRHLSSLSVMFCLGVTDASIAEIASGCPELRTLNTVRCLRVTDASIEAVGRSCPQLEALLVSQCPAITDRALTVVAKNCRRLRQLAVQGGTGVTDASITRIAESCGVLDRLHLIQCGGVTDASVRVVGTKCARLQALDVRGCAGVTEDGLSMVRELRPAAKVMAGKMRS